MAQPTKHEDEAVAETAPAPGSSALDDILKQLAATPDETRSAGAREAGGVAAGPFIGRFEIVRLLGRGGFGVVYQARDPELGRHVAIKVIRSDRLEEREDRRLVLDLFRGEAEAAAKLNHPNIVTIHEIGTHEGLPYLVLELLTGETLARRIERGRLPPADAVALLAQICRGLTHAHAARVIHRDVKPSNVYVREDGQVKILDFGLARVEEALTGGGRPVAHGGTPGYMSPEQWRGEAQDERTDLYACGVILFEMLCGRPPFAAAERDAQPVDLAARMKGLPAELIAITERALAPEPIQRYQSAQQLLDALLETEHRGERIADAAQPYRYLEHFVEEDAPWFFGRESEVGRLEQMLATRAFVAVVGPSGAGKSSLIHAGLLARLRRQGRWTALTMRPGSYSMRLLRQRLVESCGDSIVSRLLPGDEPLSDAPGRAGTMLRRHARETATRVILVADQLEELVTQVHSAAARRAFAQALLSVADDPAGPTRVVVALRDDFLLRLSKNGDLREALARNLLLLGPPDAEGLAAALRGPAARLGYDFEAGLVDEMVAAVVEEAAPLPLLQLAASRLWERRDESRRLLTRGGLEAAGGVAGILAAHANEVIHGLGGRDQVDLARRLLCELVTEEGTRRRAGREELLARFSDPKLCGRVLERLVSGRLVTSYHDEAGEWVELVHESLIAGWTQLREWLEADRADRRFRARLLAAAALWEERRRPVELLWRGATLDEASRWRQRNLGSMSQGAQLFLTRSEARQLRARRTRRAALAVAAVAALGITGGSLVAVRSYREAARLTQLRELMRTAAAADDPLVGALILAELEGQPEPPGGLAAAVTLAAQPIPMVLFRAGAPIVNAAFSPDGKRVAVSLALEHRGDVHLFSVEGSGEPMVLRGGHQETVTDVRFSRDGKRLVTASYDKTVRVWGADGNLEPPVLRHGAFVEFADFSRDGTHILTVAPEDHVARLWRADGQGEPVVFAHEKLIGTAAMSPDGSRVLTAGMDGLRLWRTDGTLVQFQEGKTFGAQFSPDGTRILSAHWGGELRVWRADLQSSMALPDALAPMANLAQNALMVPPTLWSPDGQLIVHATKRGAGVSLADGTGLEFEMERRGHGKNLLVTFSPDGTRLLTLDDEQIRVWSVETQSEIMNLRGSGDLSGGIFSPDGSRVLTFSNDGTARVWVVAEPPGALVFREARRISSLATSRDGRLVLTTSRNGTARVWPVAGGTPVVLGDPGEYPFKGAFHPDGSRVAIARQDGVTVFSVAGGEPLAHPIREPVNSVAYSPDGAWLAATRMDTATWQDFVMVLRTDGTGEPVKHALSGDGPYAVSFSPDSSHIVAALWMSGRIWRTDGKGELLRIPVTAGLVGAAYNPRGDMIMGSTRDGKLRFWSPEGQEASALTRPGGGPAAWSPDGDRVVVGLRDGTARITRLDGTGEPIVVRGHQDVVTGVAFLPDGRLVTSGDKTVRIWELDWNRLRVSLRAATTACLTSAERSSYLGEAPSRAEAAWAACERHHGRLR